MGLIRCPRHGDSSLAHVCTHVGAAARHATPLPPRARYPLELDDGGPIAVWCVLILCADCAADRGLPRPARTITHAEQEGSFADRLDTSVVCASCLAEAPDGAR